MRPRLAAPGLRRVQVRTTAVAMLAVLVVVVVAGMGVVRLFEREQMRELDERLEAATAFIDRSLEAVPSLSGEAGPEDFVQVLDAEGEIVYASDLLDGLPAVAGDLAADDGATVDVDGIGRYRVIRTPILTDRLLVFGIPLAGVEEAVADLRRTLLLGLPFLVAGLALVVWSVVGRTLRPVDDAWRQGRRLVADAGHDLRTPMAGLRALLETEPDDPADLAVNRSDALATLSRLESIVDGLSVLARADRGEVTSVDRRAVDLDEVVLREARVVARDGVQVDVAGVSAGQVVGAEHDLERVVQNLLDNAVRHARSSVAVTLREGGDEVVLTVGDDGPGIPPDDRERVFERFARLDEARSADDGGAGLGLSIVRDVVAAHGGTVAVDDAPLGGAELVVRLPAGTPEPAGV